ncbi:hypothetical protein SOX05_20535 [Pseudomonas putida]|uniref:hypothetical protein n=1 Tax=unclassified Pseudomonas TaxID=196821 RepID=UPI0025521D8A|nr:hypothetical protein [Pseudomonas sp. M2(2023)]MDY4312259.1 hypothetical protein [Pseudomonas putida]MDY4322545.1 hypothetical protein [Pseudomonas putida]MDY4355935.1 hypothetical protein [Pseudomonas putida]WIV25320.1 hypothetical protein QN085_06855 [Pseudomonas sp. M2(2023)]
MLKDNKLRFTEIGKYDANELENIFTQLEKNEIFKPADKKIIKSEELIYDTLNEFEKSTLGNGRFRIWQGEARFDCLFHEKPDTEYLYVFLNGSRGEDLNSFAPIPRFGRWSWHQLFNGSTLFIEDPMLYKYETLNLGWYYGTSDVDYLESTLNIVKAVQKKINAAKIIFYGSSGGGYAALQLAARLPDSFAISINPQTQLFKWGSANSFTEHTNIDLEVHDQRLRNFAGEAVAKNKSSKYFVIQNALSHDDCSDHFLPFCSQVGHNAQYGLSSSNNILTWLYSTPGGHNSTDNKSVLYFILDLALSFFNTNNFAISDKTSELYKVVNTLWHTSFHLQDLLKERKEAATPEPGRAKDNFITSKQLARAGKLDDALDLARKAVSLNPSNIIYLINLGDIQRKIGKTEAALETLLLAHEVQPDHPNLNFQISATYSVLKNFGAALDHAKISVIGDPTNISFRNNYTNILRNTQDYDEAIANLEETFNIDPDSPWTHVQASRIWIDLKDANRAIKHAQLAADLSPSATAFQNHLSYTKKIFVTSE